MQRRGKSRCRLPKNKIHLWYQASHLFLARVILFSGHSYKLFKRMHSSSPFLVPLSLVSSSPSSPSCASLCSCCSSCALSLKVILLLFLWIAAGIKVTSAPCEMLPFARSTLSLPPTPAQEQLWFAGQLWFFFPFLLLQETNDFFPPPESGRCLHCVRPVVTLWFSAKCIRTNLHVWFTVHLQCISYIGIFSFSFSLSLLLLLSLPSSSQWSSLPSSWLPPPPFAWVASHAHTDIHIQNSHTHSHPLQTAEHQGQSHFPSRFRSLSFNSWLNSPTQFFPHLLRPMSPSLRRLLLLLLLLLLVASSARPKGAPSLQRTDTHLKATFSSSFPPFLFSFASLSPSSLSPPLNENAKSTTITWMGSHSLSPLLLSILSFLFSPVFFACNCNSYSYFFLPVCVTRVSVLLITAYCEHTLQ